MATFKAQVSFGLLNPTMTGERTVHVREGDDGPFSHARVGDKIVFNDVVETTITRVERFRSVEALLRTYNPQRVCPGLSKKELLENLRAMMPNVGKKGVHAIAFSIRPLRT